MVAGKHYFHIQGIPSQGCELAAYKSPTGD